MVIRDAGIVRALRGSFAAAVELLCLFAAGGAAAALGWSILDPVSDAGKKPAETGSPASARVVSLPGDDPFLRAAAGRPSAVAASNFTLHATLAGPDGAGSAIISAPGLPQASYRVGDMAGDARITRVGPDFVEIDQNSRISRLVFAGSGAPLLQLAQPAPPPPVDRTALVNAMTLRIVERGGDAVGLEVVARDPSIVQAAGFLPGDIIITVAGLQLTHANLAAQQVRILAGGPVELGIQRQGGDHTINLQRVIP